mmetsp:Transcript_31745/g.91209  ORF Transcript_31745/g.91209 Transcript_31745/m.91209 type:complete len:208 (-) Transcript_31745:29-652(-)
MRISGSSEASSAFRLPLAILRRALKVAVCFGPARHMARATQAASTCCSALFLALESVSSPPRLAPMFSSCLLRPSRRSFKAGSAPAPCFFTRSSVKSPSFSFNSLAGLPPAPPFPKSSVNNPRLSCTFFAESARTLSPTSSSSSSSPPWDSSTSPSSGAEVSCAQALMEKGASFGSNCTTHRDTNRTLGHSIIAQLSHMPQKAQTAP